MGFTSIIILYFYKQTIDEIGYMKQIEQKKEYNAHNINANNNVNNNSNKK